EQNQTVEMDWFELKITVIVGDFHIPFTLFRIIP
ncbi:hypothetical protein EZS27_034185, partial [termite gut metagenome]